MADPDPSILLPHSDEIDGDDRFGLGSLVRLSVPWGEEARALSELPDSLSEPLDDP